MTHAIAQIHCCHLDLGSFMVVCGEPLGGSTRNTLLAACHFLSQSTWLGSERNYFDYIFKIPEMNMVRRFCENNVFRRSLPAFYCRNQQLSGTWKIQLSAVHIERLKQIYAADYAIGWC
ncbi:MAG: hypothetical protein ACNA8O_05965 [Cyanobacteriota bacterium]